MEKWIKWEPIEGLSTKYYVESILDDIKGVKIILSEAYSEKNKVHITFANSIDAYSSTYSSFRQDMIFFLDKQYGTKFYSEWTFFTITNSMYLKWLSNQSDGIINKLSPIHFSLITMNFILDIVATYEPKVELIEKGT